MSPTVAASDVALRAGAHAPASARDLTRASAIALAGAMAVLLAAPFEATKPLLARPGQSLSTVEAVLLLALGAWALAVAVTCTRAGVPLWRGLGVSLDERVLWPAIVFILALFTAAVAAPAYRANAVHMAGRLALAGGLALLTANAVRTPAHARRLLLTATVSGALVAVLVIVDYTGWAPMQRVLLLFRVQAASVGSQVRASGPFQYPTIASMFLEICFTCGLALLPWFTTRSRVRHGHCDHSRAIAAALFCALLAMAAAIVFTFTRAGLVSMAVALAVIGGWRWRRAGFDAGVLALAAVGLGVLAMLPLSRSAAALRLRMSTEQQDNWYRAELIAPPTVTLPAGGRLNVPITLTNTGAVTWDSSAAQPFGVSSHWLLADHDRLVSWEGLRAFFPAPVAPGETITVPVILEAPREPGAYRVVWDLFQEHVLWFSTEPNAELTISQAAVTGAATGQRIDVDQLRSMPLPATRPGRRLLWTAAARMLAEQPWLGVGPDNFRLLYGPYAHLPRPDARVHTNNMYLELIVGGGLVLAAALAWLLAALAHVVRQAVAAATDDARLAAASAAVAAVAVIALHGLVDSFLGFTGTYAAIAIMIGLLLASGRPGPTHAHRV